MGAEDLGPVAPGRNRPTVPEPRRRAGPSPALSSVKSMLDAPGGVGRLFRFDGLRSLPLLLAPGRLVHRLRPRPGGRARGGREVPPVGGGRGGRDRPDGPRRHRTATGRGPRTTPPRCRRRATPSTAPSSRDDWPNFQIDGYGTWLWAVSEHVDIGGRRRSSTSWARAWSWPVSYLEAVDLDPCYDCWEENGQAVHTSTLACVYGGLSASAALLGRPAARRKADEVGDYILSRDA